MEYVYRYTTYQWIILLFCCEWGAARIDVSHFEGDHSLVKDAEEVTSNNLTYTEPPMQNWTGSQMGAVNKSVDEKNKTDKPITSPDHITVPDSLSDDFFLKTYPRYTGATALCESNPEKGRIVWVGSRTATLQWNFKCAASRCVVDCTRRTHPENQPEVWSCKILENGTLEANGNRLSPKSAYKCRVVGTTGYLMIPGTDVTFTTRDGKPYPPGLVYVSNITSTSFIVSWAPPIHVDREPVDYYLLNVYKEVPSYFVNTACGLPNGQNVVFNLTGTSKLVNGLLPYYKHRLVVYAYNQYGQSSRFMDGVVLTRPGEPGQCENVTIFTPDTVPGGQPSFTVTWTEPCFWNGQPYDTYISIDGKRPDNPKRHINITHYFLARHKTSMDPTYSKSITFNASMDFNYTVELFVRIINYNNKLRTKRSNTFNVVIPPGLASVNSQWLMVRPEIWMSTEDESAQATLHLQNSMLNDTNGTIKHVALMVAEKGYQGLRQRQYLPLPNWPDEKNWYAAMEGEHVKLYQATPKYFKLSIPEDNITHPFNLGADICPSLTTTDHTEKEPVSEPAPEDEYDDYDSREFLKRDQTITTIATSTTTRPVPEADYYCNGPLKKNVEYAVRLRVFTRAGYTDSREIFFLTGTPTDQSKSSMNQLCFYALIPMGLAATLLILMWVRKRKRSNGVASAPSPGQKSTFLKTRKCRKNSRRRSISPEKLPKLATRFLSQKTNLEKEFEELNEISAAWAAKVSCSVGRLQENRLKNRYADVVPYDYNRVKLSSESTSQTDYMNASFIQGFSLNVEYIACQGPTMDTTNDFWQMVFDQKISLIVMLTSLVENGMAKCCQYFSEMSENKEWMDFTLKCTSRLDLANYTVRELELYKKTTQQKREIKHFQFRDWPDFGCPSDIDGILEFCEVLRGNCVLRNYSTTIVHCSAGIGRTGTLIALDILLQHVHYNRKMDVMRTVLRLREQRQWMIRTVEQYAFLYRCLKTAAEKHFTSGT